ncbi:MAG: Fur family transcriptional regulator [Gemmatimonadaceae bacterium]
MGADDAVMEGFRTYLRDHNLPVTAQRLAIADVVLHSQSHLSADEIERELETRHAAAGTATVYRTLDLLLESGLVVERDFGEGFRRYEPARDIPHHEHLLCTVCGRVTEFRDERLERMSTLIAETHGFARQSHRLVIYGVCASCQRDGGPAGPAGPAGFAGPAGPAGPAATA